MPIDKITEIDAVDIALEMLKDELPGFESRFSKDHMVVQVNGDLRIGMQVDSETIYYPIPQMATYSDLGRSERQRQRETELERLERLDRERKYVRHMLEPLIRHIVDQTRERGIEVLNLGPVIQAVADEAASTARREAYREGFNDGKRAGRREALKELIEAADIDWSQLLGEDI